MGNLTGDLTPANVLREYRRQSHKHVNEQAELFRSLSPGDQRELLFYMVTHLVQGLQSVHHLVDPEGAATRGIDTIKTSTQ